MSSRHPAKKTSNPRQSKDLHSDPSDDSHHQPPAYYPKEECGIMGVFNHQSAANLTYLGLHALQHRGQETTGIVSSNGETLYRITGMGTVTQVFTKDRMDKLDGHIAIGHNRYSTSGGSFLRNAQPLRAHSVLGPVALAHNGNLINSWHLRRKMEAEGSIFQTSIDSEVIVHAMARSGDRDLIRSLFSALKLIDGAYSLLVINKEEMFAVRDPHGFRPLCYGEINNVDNTGQKATFFASETCGLDILGADYLRDVEPGEVLHVHSGGQNRYFPWRQNIWTVEKALESSSTAETADLPGTGTTEENTNGSALNNGAAPAEEKKAKTNLCIFEFIYFSRPDSKIFNESVYEVRKRFGAALANENPVEADVVIPVPDSSTVAAIGYAEESGIPFATGLIRSHYVGRTFIEPDQKIRDFGVKLKFNTVESILKDKRVVVVDDSIMRGTTSRKIIKMLRSAGAKEIHMRISAPPTKFPCYYGIDIPTKSELIASDHSLEEIRKYLRVDSITYLSIESMLKAAGRDPDGWCVSCFTGKYPLDFIDREESKQKDLFDNFISSEYQPR